MNLFNTVSGKLAAFGGSKEWSGLKLRGDETFVVDFRKSFTPIISAGSGEPSIVRAGTNATIIDYLGNVIVVDANEGRIDGARRISAGNYSDLGANGKRIQPSINKGELIEESRINSAEESDDIDDAFWVGNNKNSTSDTGTNIAGRPAQGFIADVSVGTISSFNHVYTTTASQTHSMTMFAAPGDKDWVFMKAFDIVEFKGGTVFFDVANGVIGTEEVQGAGGTIVDASIIPVNGGYICRVSITTGSGLFVTMVQGPANADGTEEFTGDNSTVNCWINGLQDELTEKDPTSFIPTSGGAATRPDEIIEYDSDNFTAVGSIAGEFYFNYDPSTNSDNRSLYTFQPEGLVENSATRVHINTAGRVQFVMFGDGGVGELNLWETAPLTEPGFHKFAAGWESGNINFYVDGVQATEVTANANLPLKSSIDKFYLGSRSTSGSPDQFTNANVSYLLKYDTRLADAELQALSLLR